MLTKVGAVVPRGMNCGAEKESSTLPINAPKQNLPIKDTLNKGHLSNMDTVCSPNHIELCTRGRGRGRGEERRGEERRGEERRGEERRGEERRGED